MWLESKSVNQEIGSSITAPFSVFAEHAKSKFAFKSLKTDISSHTLFLKSLTYIFTCVYSYADTSYTHTQMYIYIV